jgi:hypothetical protein
MMKMLTMPRPGVTTQTSCSGKLLRFYSFISCELEAVQKLRISPYVVLTVCFVLLETFLLREIRSLK